MLTAMVMVLGADAASGAISVRFDPPSARPGAKVVGRTVDASMVMITERRLALFLAPRDVADAITSPRDSRLTAIGELRGDPDDVGRLAFIVPELPPGPYEAVAHCRSCETTFTIGTLRVTPGAAPLPGTSGEPETEATGSWLSPAVAATTAATVLVLAVTVGLAVRRRRTTQ